MSGDDSEDLSEGLPTGDWSKPVREASGGVEGMGTDLQDRMDEVNDQNLGEVGAGFDRRTPRAPTDAESNKPRPPGAAFPGDDEGPLGTGGQLRGPDAGGGGSS